MVGRNLRLSLCSLQLSRGAPENAMIPSTFATHSLPASEQLEAWRSWYVSVFGMASRLPAADGFRAKTKAWMRDGFGLTHVRSPPVSTTRSTTLIRRNPVDHWCISFGKTDTTRFKIGDDTLEVPARVPFVFSLGEETHTERT